MSVLVVLGVGLVLVYGFITLLLWLVSPIARPLDRKKCAAVVVVGDIGHSPRMCFHALSIARCGWDVRLIGYTDSAVMEDVKYNSNITVVPLPKVERALREPFLFYALRRATLQHWILYKTLKAQGLVDVVLVQNPPSIPTFASARFFTLWGLPGTKLIIDWHNLGYSILSMNHGRIPTTIYRAYEMVFGRIAYIHLVVSVGLGVMLRRSFGVNAKRIMPLPDRPYKSYVVDDAERNAVRRDKFGDLLSESKNKVVVTSTSYTPDEDLGILLDALEAYDKVSTQPVTVVVTGKGPLRDSFAADAAGRNFKHVFIRTAWLPYELYHYLLAIADVGVSLHSSSSGWDLPMKIVDMFGAGLPVLALEFPALGELVKANENGYTFRTARELANKLDILLSTPNKLEALREAARREATETWWEQWQEKLGPIFGQGHYPVASSSSSSDSE